jgi:choline dehydrogenase-like flavoprotein
MQSDDHRHGRAAAGHIAGTARMGTDPRTSACDPGARLLEVDNVRVADAATFPTFSGFDPPNTVLANAPRVARGIG